LSGTRNGHGGSPCGEGVVDGDRPLWQLRCIVPVGHFGLDVGVGLDPVRERNGSRGGHGSQEEEGLQGWAFGAREESRRLVIPDSPAGLPG